MVSPSFAWLKTKNNQVCVIGGFKILNNQLNFKSYPMPKIIEVLLGLEGFKYAAQFDLNMVYYYIQLSKDASTLCVIILPWVNHRYKNLPMEVRN